MGTCLRAAVTAATMLSFGTAQAAVPSNCLTREETRGVVAYLGSPMLDSVIAACKPMLPNDSYLANGATVLAFQLYRDRDKAWPMMRSAFPKIAMTNGTNASDWSNIPNETARTTLDSIFKNKIGKKIIDTLSAQDCRDFDAILSRMAPLGAEGIVDLLTDILMVSLRKDKKMPTCSAGINN